jgi:hypothetical protein
VVWNLHQHGGGAGRERQARLWRTGLRPTGDTRSLRRAG